MWDKKDYLSQGSQSAQRRSKAVWGSAPLIKSNAKPCLSRPTFKNKSGGKCCCFASQRSQRRWVIRISEREILTKTYLELKLMEINHSVNQVSDVHKKQLLTYLKLSNKPLGLLINFNEALLKDGITRIINELWCACFSILPLKESENNSEPLRTLWEIRFWLCSLSAQLTKHWIDPCLSAFIRVP